MSHNQGRPVRERKPPKRFCDQKFLNGRKDQYDRCLGGYKWVRLWRDNNYHQPQAVAWEEKEEELLEKILRDGEKLTSHGYKPDEWLVDDDYIEDEVGDEVEEVDGEEVDGEESDGEESDDEENDGEENDGEESDGEESDDEERDDEYKPNDYMQGSSQEDTDEEYTDEEYTDEE